eukprot:727929-Pyramimonas_sp.AAC.1
MDDIHDDRGRARDGAQDREQFDASRNEFDVGRAVDLLEREHVLVMHVLGGGWFADVAPALAARVGMRVPRDHGGRIRSGIRLPRITG